MNIILKLIALFAVLLMLSACAQDATAEDHPPIAIAIHGGAGSAKKGSLTPEKEKAYSDILNRALDAGYKILENGGTSLDAVTTVITLMEDSPLFNAGKGAVFTYEETNELDASIMVGRDRSAGAVAGVTTVKNPILLARKVMENSPHVMMARDGAEAFAREQGLEIVDPSWFYTEERMESLRRRKEREKDQSINDAIMSDEKFGTVGVAALDKEGNLSAGTSTGGMTYKRWGRIGDSPVIGAGTWADNATCAVSATGHGEYFIRWGVAQDISARMAYKGESLETAANTVIMDILPAVKGTGGIIAVDRDGNVAMPFNTSGMYRAAIDAAGNRTVAMYRDDK